MKLRRLAINRLPGISVPFEIETAGAGFHVVFGPNGIGKSSICRAVEGLYWGDYGPSQRTSVSGEFELDGEVWWAEREGPRVRWQRGGEDSAPPALPPSHHHRSFFLRLRDLIDPSPDGTRDIATEIRRQMSGGFDLDQIASDLFAGTGPRYGRSERRDFDKASQDVREAEGKQSGLQRRADQLETLRTQLGAAESGARRLTSVDRALGLAGRLEQHACSVAEMSVLPASLSKLTGREVEQVEGLQTQVNGLTERARSLEQQLAVARDTQQDIALSAPLEDAELKIWRAHADELSRVELALQSARTELSACRKELDSTLSALGGGNFDEVELTLVEHGQLFEFLRAVEAHKARVKAIEERLRLLERVDRPDDSQRDPDTLRSAAEALRSWLRAPVPESLSDRIRTRRSWLILAFTVAVSGAGLAIFVEPMFALLVAAGVGMAVPGLLLRSAQADSGERKAARDAFESTSVGEPEKWEMPSVEWRLRDLEKEAATLDARLQRARDRDVEREGLKSELDGLAAAEAALDARRQKLRGGLNLRAILPDAELVDLARALDQYRSASGKEQHAAGEVEYIGARHSQLLSTLASVLERHGEPRPTDAVTAAARLNNLADRNVRLVRAVSDEKQATSQLQQVSSDRDAALDSIKHIYAEAGLADGDMHGLVALLQSLPQYLEMKSTAARLESQIELDRAELTRAGEATLADRDRGSLEQLQRALAQTADKAVELRDEIADTNAQVNDAKRGSSLQDLIAAREEARATLQDRRDEVLFARAGQFLIEAVEEEYEQTQMPRVLERARAHFSAFTHHNYELRLSKGAKSPRLIAIDLRSGEGLGLEELSDGTRAQLLLAARIAFAEEVEQGKTLPLFLDEALDQSDPARFAAIVRSLGRVANDQARQIFYLTSDPLDTDRIQHALAEENCEMVAAIDLGLIRTKAASVKEPGALRVEQRPSIPVPDGLSAEDYGVALGVPMFRPARGHAEQHFFHVLSDDLDLVHDFLANGIQQVGQWKTVSGTALATRLGSRAIPSEEITYRSELLEVFCELWKQGRGRPVDREALENSGALSERYLDSVVAIADELGGDPERLMAALEEIRDPRLKGFRRTSYYNLERYLRENAYLDDLPVLNEDELRLRALATPAANKLPEGVASDCLNRWWTLAQRVKEPGS